MAAGSLTFTRDALQSSLPGGKRLIEVAWLGQQTNTFQDLMNARSG